MQERWHTYFILPKQSHYFDDQQVRRHWQALLGERMLLLDDPAAVCELIAVTIGMVEGAIDLVDGLVDLQTAGSAQGSCGRPGAGGDRHRRGPARCASCRPVAGKWAGDDRDEPCWTRVAT